MEWKVWRFPSTLVPPHTHLPPWPTLHNRGAFVTITTPSPLTLGVPLGVVLSMGFGKCMTFIHITVSYRVDSSTKNLLCSVCSSLPQPLATTDLFTVSIVLPFPECHTVCGLFRLASFTQWYAFEVPPWLFKAWRFISSQCWIIFHCLDTPQFILSTHLLKDILVASKS